MQHQGAEGYRHIQPAATPTREPRGAVVVQFLAGSAIARQVNWRLPGKATAGAQGVVLVAELCIRQGHCDRVDCARRWSFRYVRQSGDAGQRTPEFGIRSGVARFGLHASHLSAKRILLPVSNDIKRGAMSPPQGIGRMARFVWRDDPGVIAFEAEDGEELTPDVVAACGALMQAHTLERIEHLLYSWEPAERERRKGPLPFRYASPDLG